MTSPYCFPGRSSRWNLLAFFGGLSLASIVSAQTAPATPATLPATNSPAARPAADEPMVLSPFEVKADSDVGFAPTSALTGGRMALELKDSAMAYSALTRDFLDTMIVTDLTSATEWTTNSDKIMDPNGGGDTFNLTVLGRQRSTGGSTNRMVNFFPYYAPLDSYNVDRIDFGRGPNAVMFGNGTLGGTQVALTKRARFDHAFYRADAIVGSYDFYRTAVDINTPINRLFATRVNALYQKGKGWRDNAQDDNKAASATISFKPTPKTEIRLEGELGRQERQIPTLAVQDQFAGWNGLTTFDASNNLGTTAPAATTGPTGTNDARGVGLIGGNSYYFSPRAGLGNTILEYQNTFQTLGAGATATTPLGPYTFAAAGGASFNTAGSSVLFGPMIGIPDVRFDAINASPYTDFIMPSQTFVNGAQGPVSIQDYKDIQLTASHAITDNLQIEAAGMYSLVDSDINRVQNGFPNARVDITRSLPDGTANPNFGRFYGEGQYLHVPSKRLNKGWRAAVAYTKNLGKWGHYGFNGMLGSTQQRQFNGPNTVLSLGYNPDHRQWQGIDLIRVRNYFGDPLSADALTGPFVFKDNNYTMNGVTNNPVNATVTPSWVAQMTSASESMAKYNYGLVGVTAKYFDGKLVVTGAMRRDAFTQNTRQSVRIGDYPMNWDGHTIIWKSNAPADWTSLMYRPYDSAGVRGGAIPALSRPTVTTLSTVATPTTNTATPWFVANPSGVAVRDLRYEGDRFQDDFNPPSLDSSKVNHAFGAIYHIAPWVAVGYNNAGSYSLPGTPTPAIDGTILPPVDAKGFDVTTRFTLFKGRLNIIYTYFQNQEVGGYVSAGGSFGQVTTNGNINGVYEANAVGDLSSTGRNIRNGANLNGAANDTRDKRSQGNEVEVVGNVTKGWRVQASWANNRVESINAYPMSIAYIDANAALLKQIVQDAGVTIGSTPIYAGGPNRAELNPFYFSSLAQATTAGFGADRVSIDQQSAVDNYNNLYLNRANYQTNPVNAGKTVIVNAYTDYTIQTGLLKKLRLGVGYQYRGQIIAGYRGSDTIVNPANPATAIDDPSVDAYTAVFLPSNDRWTASLGYSWRTKNGMDFIFNLKIDNLLDQSQPIFAENTALRPKGGNYASPARESVPVRLGEYRQPRSFVFSTTVKF